MKKNDPEAEINRIRIELYEETKDLTIEEQTRRSNDLAERLAAQYGFKIYPSANTVRRSGAM